MRFICVCSVFIVCLVLTLALHFGLKHKPPPPRVKSAGVVDNTYIEGPVIGSNFADPCHIKVNDTWYAFATNRFIRPRRGQINIQVATSKDFHNWTLTDRDALPNTGAWSTATYTWAPDVVQVVSNLQHCVRHVTKVDTRMMAVSSCTTQ
jgi:hypothetical protein